MQRIMDPNTRPSNVSSAGFWPGMGGMKYVQKAPRTTMLSVTSHAHVDACGVADGCDYNLYIVVHSRQFGWCFVVL